MRGCCVVTKGRKLRQDLQDGQDSNPRRIAVIPRRADAEGPHKRPSVRILARRTSGTPIAHRARLYAARDDTLHLFGDLDSEKIQAAMKNPRRQLAERETRASRRLLRFQNRAGFVKRVEAVGQLEEIIRQNVGPKIVQNRRDDFAELTESRGQIFSSGAASTSSFAGTNSSPAFRKIERMRT